MSGKQSAEELRETVFECAVCEGAGFGFTRPAEDRPFYKFPPTIGARTTASILFVGINPRISAGNIWLHRLVMSGKQAFDQLAANRVNGQPYVGAVRGEPHYNYHVRLVQRVFGHDVRFEDHAAVTELFLCATESSYRLPRDTSPCADRYLWKTIRQVQPRVIIAVGKPVEAYFRRLGSSTESEFPVTIDRATATVIIVPHPNHYGPRVDRWREAAQLAKALL